MRVCLENLFDLEGGRNLSKRGIKNKISGQYQLLDINKGQRCRGWNER